MKIKKIIFLAIIILMVFPCKISATEQIMESTKEMLGVSTFISESEKFSQEVFEDIDFSEVLNSAITGKIDNSTLAKKLLNILGKEIRNQLTLIGSIIVIIVIHSILKSVSDGLENEGISKVSYFVQYILIVTLIMKSFSEIVMNIKDTTQSLVGYSYSLIPLLISLMMFTGNLVSAGAVQPILLLMITFIGTFISNFLLPMVLIGTALGIISKISDKVQIDKLAKTFKSSTVWILGLVLTVFTGVLSLESSLTGKVDGITTKATKAIVTNAIPVVGKILSDASETVLGSGIVLRNAVGLVGVIVIIGICAMPFIKLGVITALYQILSAICEPIADKKIISIIEQMRDTFKVLLGMVSAISIMLIIGVTIVIKVSSV